MKKIILIALIMVSIITTAIMVFDSSTEPSTNNEGLRKPILVANKTSAAMSSSK